MKRFFEDIIRLRGFKTIYVSYDVGKSLTVVFTFLNRNGYSDVVCIIFGVMTSFKMVTGGLNAKIQLSLHRLHTISIESTAVVSTGTQRMLNGNRVRLSITRGNMSSNL